VQSAEANVISQVVLFEDAHHLGRGGREGGRREGGREVKWEWVRREEEAYTIAE